MLVATDALEIDTTEGSLEAGRRYRARRTFRRDDALADALGILSELGPRLPLTADEQVREVVRAVSSIPTSIAEDRLAAVTEHLVASLDQAHRCAIRLPARLEEAVGQAERDPLTGLHNRRFLDRFLARRQSGAPVAVAGVPGSAPVRRSDVGMAPARHQGSNGSIATTRNSSAR